MRDRIVSVCIVVTLIYPSLLAKALASPNRSVRGSQAAQQSSGAAPTDEESQIRAVLDAQAVAWNRGDVDSFMTSYWKSDETLFVGANGITRGYDAILARYHKVYPNRRAMGHVAFSNVQIQIDCPDRATVIGQYQLEREHDHPAGVFTLNMRKFPEGWRIVLDHTTAFPATPAAR